MELCLTLSNELNIKKEQVIKTVDLIDQGNTVPFIARYRKEVTGGLDDVTLRKLYERLNYLRNLDERRQTVKRLIDEQGKLTKELEESIDKALLLREIEDLYRPYKSKRKTRATEAERKGLKPLAKLFLKDALEGQTPLEAAKAYVDEEKEVATAEEALQGAMDILAEMFSDNPEIREYVRSRYYNGAYLFCRAKKDQESVYDMYYDYKERVKTIADHRVLAIHRGEREGFLSVSFEVDDERMIKGLKLRMISHDSKCCVEIFEAALEDAYKRLIVPAIENEIRMELFNKAQDKAMIVFSANMKSLLMQPPVKDKIILGIDPAYRTGCKMAAIDQTGKVLATDVIYPTPPQNKLEEAKETVTELLKVHHVQVIAIGNGTATGETENFISDLLRELENDVAYVVVNEAGASVYSASELGTKEFPDYDVSLRSAVSIARRLQDPMAELVKIPPESIGVGQYQHDMNKKKLAFTLGGVVEDCVNQVGVDLNTASFSLLSYVSGINKPIAENIIRYREENGKFRNRQELRSVKQLGEKAFEQCAGFLRIQDGDNILDNTSVHPESYEATERLLRLLQYTEEDVLKNQLTDIEQKIEQMGMDNIVEQTKLGRPTLEDIIKECKKPGRDIRDEFPKPVFRKEVLDIKDLKEGMVLTGTVRNIADFGAFVDIGVHQDGLVHISRMSDAFVKNPLHVVSVGETVKVKVLDVDLKKKRISLSMKDL